MSNKLKKELKHLREVIDSRLDCFEKKIKKKHKKSKNKEIK